MAYDVGEHQVVALAGTSVRLRSSDGAEQVVLGVHLMGSLGFAVIDGAPTPELEPFVPGQPADCGARCGTPVGSATWSKSNRNTAHGRAWRDTRPGYAGRRPHTPRSVNAASPRRRRRTHADVPEPPRTRHRSGVAVRRQSSSWRQSGISTMPLFPARYAIPTF